MKLLDSEQLMDLGYSMAQDLMRIAEERGIQSRDLVMSFAIAQRILHRILSPEQVPDVLTAVQEADATYEAIASHTEDN